MSRITNGFITVIEENKDSIARICRVYGKTEEDQEDLFQEVILAVWKSFPSFKGKSSVKTWIFRIALNICMQISLKEKNKKETHIDGIDLKYLTSHEDHTTTLHDKENAELLYAFISKLQDPDKTVITLFLEGISNKDISSIVGMKENTVAVRIHRIKHKLYLMFRQKVEIV